MADHSILPDPPSAPKPRLINEGTVVEQLKKGLDAIHRYFLWILISVCLGIFIGISVSKTFYKNKMDECIKIGGLVYETNVYNIIKK